MDDQLIEDLEKRYEGLGCGVEIVRACRQGSKVKYRVHFRGRLSEEDVWVPEKCMSRVLIEQHRPSRKGTWKGDS